MAIIAESSDENSNAPPHTTAPSLPQQRGNYSDNLEALAQAAPWLDDALQHARHAQQTIQSSIESAITVTKSRLDRILTTSSAHFNQTLDSLQDVKAEYHVYEDLAFWKIKEGIGLAVSHPLITTGAFLSLGFLGLKRPRRFLFYKARCLFVSEEAMLSKADAKVKELKESINFLKAESEKWEKNAVQAEEALIRGKTKLRHAGKQIQSAIRSSYKIERKAAGLKDVLKELPHKEASMFRSEVSKLASEAKKERNFLNKEVTKISNHGISV